MDRLLPQSVATLFSIVVDVGGDPENIGEIKRYHFEGDPPPDDVAEALRMLRVWMAPADHNDIVVELGKLRALVVTRKEDDESLALVLGAFAEQIANEGYPIDVVRQARLDSINTNRFWPSWFEFRELCDRLYLKRRSYCDALERYWLRKSRE